LVLISKRTSFIDPDSKYFKTDEEFEVAADKTYANFQDGLGANPTQICSGNGYHFYNPQFSNPIEAIGQFKKFSQYKLSRDFLRFEEQFMTDGKADPAHSLGLAFGNTVLRIPHSFNSKLVQFDGSWRIINIPPESEVRVVKGRYWDDIRREIDPILPDYYTSLQDKVSMDLDEQLDRIKKRTAAKRPRGNYKGRYKDRYKGKHKLDWIERLLDTPLDDYRKYTTKFIIVPYLANIRRLSREDTWDITSTWLNECDLKCSLRFNIDRKINEALDKVDDYLPQGRDKLRTELTPLYTLLEEKGIVY
jgi:hypothetical protein